MNKILFAGISIFAATNVWAETQVYRIINPGENTSAFCTLEYKVNSNAFAADAVMETELGQNQKTVIERTTKENYRDENYSGAFRRTVYLLQNPEKGRLFGSYSLVEVNEFGKGTDRKTFQVLRSQLNYRDNTGSPPTTFYCQDLTYELVPALSGQ